MSKSLPLITTPAPERRDAARNRAAVLDAANELIGQCGVHSLTMDALAAEAGVGKGTIFRRFGSREGLMASLLDHAESEWQAAAISGPPPLGPGAPAMDRLLAFGESRMRLHLKQAALIEEAGRTWEDNYAVTSFIGLHVRHLLLQLGVSGDVGYLATALIAPLSVPILRQQLEHDGLSQEQVLAGWADLVDRLTR